ncbi:Helicase 2 [Aratus pisonii nudivirus]|nr:Helicase 2 [Aratus pisonii nudivirus]
MNPITSLLIKDEYDEIDYKLTLTYLRNGLTTEYLKRLNINTVKEMLFNCQSDDPKNKNILCIKDVDYMHENDCYEYNLIYNKNFTINTYNVLSNSEKSKLTLSLLNKNQLKVIYQIFDTLSSSFNPSGILNDPVVILLDAASGTGKSFLINCMYICFKNIKSVVIAKSKILLKSICSIENTDDHTNYTTCKFTMDYFNMEYDDAIVKFSDKYDIEDFEIVIKELLNQKKWDFNLLIVDEYSMESPLLLTVLLIKAKVENVNVIFMGDNKQQNTLTTSKLHVDTNYNLIKSLPHLKCFELVEQVRIKDNDLKTLIKNIKEYIGDDVKSNVENNMMLKYDIYCNYKEKFTALKKNILKDVYMTETHYKIKKRLETLKEYVTLNKINHTFEPFELITQKGVKSVLLLPDDYKYQSSLMLIEGGQYLYNKSSFVTLIKINESNVEIQYNDNKLKLTINKIIWNKQYHECVDDNYKWIISHIPEDEEQEKCNILQYPLRLIFFTYYFVQGLTYSNETIAIDLDAKYVNSLYVAFSRVKTLDQIVQIETNDFINLVLTSYMDDNYLYKVNRPTLTLIENLQNFYSDDTFKFDVSIYQFYECSLNEFMRSSRRYLKTLKFNKVQSDLTLEPLNKKRRVMPSNLSDILVKWINKSQ